MNRRMDAGIGRILDELDRGGLTDNTIVLFASDNGPQFGGEGDMCTTRANGDFNGCKGLVYEGGIRVPAILRWPAGLAGGRRAHDLIHFTDWLPTIASAAGADLPPDVQLDGRDALPVLRDGQPQPDRTLFWQWNRYTPVPTCNAAVRSGRWKLIRPRIKEAMQLAREDTDMDRRLKYEPEGITDITRTPEPERVIPDPPPPLLFDLDSDPYERRDLSREQPQVVSKLQREIDTWFESVESERGAIDD